MRGAPFFYLKKGTQINQPGGDKVLGHGAANEDALKFLVARYLKLLFGFALSFGAYSREQAFKITVSSFVKALKERPRLLGEHEFLEILFRHAQAECAQTAPAGVTDLSPFGEFPPQQKMSLAVVREALVRLSPAEKTILLLRDQCHLPFERISGILNTGIRETRSACLSARESFRAEVKAILEKPAGGPPHAM